jgi:queuine tRNA-ribosyltransferase
LQCLDLLTIEGRAFSADAATPDAPPPPPLKRRRLHPLAPPPPPSAFQSYTGQDAFSFTVIHQSRRSAARVGRISTPHGPVDTPGFVPVATNAALKAVDLSYIDEKVPLQLAFCNTYHLMLQPGAETVAAAGGLHAFMSRRRDRPLITDSGGFQVFSLAYGTVHAELHSLKRSAGRGGSGGATPRRGNLVRKISEEGVTFRSYRDGTLMTLSPESSIDAQKALGADIILPLDELPPYNISPEALAASVARSHRWEARSLLRHAADPRDQACYGIIHGGSDPALRAASAAYIASLPFDGFAVGGALGKDREELVQIMDGVMGGLPRDRPVHVLGIADPLSVPRLVPLGCDTFDSCHATRVGRHGGVLTETGTLRVAAAAHAKAYRPPVEGCACPVCTTHSMAYLHHLVKAREPVAATLLSIHNLAFMVDQMRRLREAIYEDRI